MQSEDLSLDFQEPGFVRTIHRASGEMKLLSQLGRHAVISLHNGRHEDMETREQWSQMLQPLPWVWYLSLTGVVGEPMQVVRRIAAQIEFLQPAVKCQQSSHERHREAAVCNPDGSMLVLLQQCSHAGLPRTERDVAKLAVHVKNQLLVGPVIGAMQGCYSQDMKVVVNDINSGMSSQGWDFTDTSQIRAFLEEQEARLDEMAYCTDANLLRYTRLDLSALLKNTRQLVDF